PRSPYRHLELCGIAIAIIRRNRTGYKWPQQILQTEKGTFAKIMHCIFVQFYHVFSRGVQSKTAHGAAICAVPCAVVFIQGNTA
ncbi:MAG: hypothetical protein WAT97_08500, partial [Gemmiger qucibialis]